MAALCCMLGYASASTYSVSNGRLVLGSSVPGVSTDRLDYTVGSTPGTLSVDQGAATYSIPVPVAPSVAGMEPSLSIEYSSQGGNGPLGMGFALSGLSQITRCSRTVAQDGERGFVNYDADDRFCFDGQRLLAVRGRDGADGTEYRTEIDGFSRVISYGRAGSGPAWFKVWTKSGQVLEYGKDDAAVPAPGRTDGSILAWSVKHIDDTVGNRISVEYHHSAGWSESYPLAIFYPGGSVAFVYEDRPEAAITKYANGAPYRLTKRMSRIEAWSGDQQVGELRFDYQEDGVSPVSRITTIMQCDGGGNCFPPTVFTWTGGDMEFPGSQRIHWGGLCRPGSTSYGVCNDANNSDTLQFPDISGDGLADICYRGDRGIQCFVSDGAGGWTDHVDTTFCANGSTRWGGCNDQDNYQTIRFADLNGDGRDDLFYRSDSGIYVRTFDGNGFQFQSKSGLCANGNSQFGKCDSSDNFGSLVLAEVTGDGNVDLCYRGDRGIQCVPGDGQGGFLEGEIIATDICANSSTKYGGCNGEDNWNTIRYLDVNADGLADLFYRGDSGIQVHLATGSGFRHVSKSPVCGNNWNGHGVCNDADNHGLIYNPDINGDNIPDLCYRGDRGIHCHTGDGAGGWVAERTTGFCRNGMQPHAHCNHDSIRFADFDGDGNDDLLFRSHEGINLYLNNGREFGPRFRFQDYTYSPKWAGLFASSASTNNPSCSNCAEPVDINGDGALDIMIVKAEGIVSWSSPSSTERRVTEVSDSLGGRTEIAYQPLTDGQVYDVRGDAGDRELPLRGALYIVAATATTDGLGGTNRTTYRYGGAKIDRDGRGMLGFAWEEATDETTGRTTRTEYRQDFPFIGSPSRTRTWLANGNLISDQTVTYAALPTVGGAVMPYAAESTGRAYDLGGELVTTTVTRLSDHDTYGNVGTVDVRTSAGGETYRKVTSSSYHNIVDANRWLLGRVTRAEVRHIDAAGNQAVRVSAFEYDAQTGLLLREIIEPDSSEPGIRQITTRAYDRFGNVVRITVAGTDSAGQAISRSTETTFTADGRFIAAIANALGHREQHSYDPRFGQRIAQTGPNRLTTTWTLDGFGRKTAEDRADGTATLLERFWVTADVPDAPSHAVYALTEQETAGGDSERLPAVTQYFDQKGRVLRTVKTGFDGRLVYEDVQYDHQGRETAHSLPYFAGDASYWVETQYDALDRVAEKVAETTRHIVLTTYAYDGLVTTETNSLGQRKTTWANAEGNLAAVEDEEGAFVEYEYDPLGNLIRTVQGDDATGKTAVTTVSYDRRNRKVAMDDADMGRWTYGYNSFDELEWQEDANGNRTEMLFDALGRMVRRDDIAADVEVATTTWEFDTAPNGNRAWVGKLHRTTGPAPGHIETVAYDANGRALNAAVETDGKRFDVGNEYDAFGRVAATVQPEGFRLEQRYNEHGYLIEQRTPASGPVDGHDADFINSLLQQTLDSAETALSQAEQYASQAAYFESKAKEYETTVRALIDDQQLVTSAPDLGDGAYTIFTDEAGNEYVKTSPQIALLHGPVATPVQIAPERLYKLMRGSGRWGVFEALTFGSPERMLSSYGYSAGAWRTERHLRLTADVNGDGMQDIVGFGDAGVSVSLATGDGFTSPRYWSQSFGYNAGGWRIQDHPRMMADVNGDGKADIVGFGHWGVEVALSIGDSFAEPQRWVEEFGYSAGGWRTDKHLRVMADVNGDGMHDVVGFGDAGVSVSLSTGSGFTQPRYWSNSYGYNAGGWRTQQHPRMMADVNGDGMQDVVGFGNAGVAVAFSTGSGFTSPKLLLDEFGYDAGGWRVANHPRMMADVNGDGKQDIVGFGQWGVEVSLSTGSGFRKPERWVGSYGYAAGGWRVENHPRMTADVNGDGLEDVVGFANAGVSVSLSTGRGFTEPEQWVDAFGHTAGGWRIESHPRMMADVNGDGLQDVVGFAGAGVSVSLAISANPELVDSGRSLFFGDFNKDGTRDFIKVSSRTATTLRTACETTANPYSVSAIDATGADLAGETLERYTDPQGTEYLTRTAAWTILHGPVATPVMTRPVEHYRLAFDRNSEHWTLQAIAADHWNAHVASTLTPVGSLEVGALSGDGTTSFRRRDAGGSAVRIAAADHTECMSGNLGPLVGRALFDNLWANAATIRSAAETLQSRADDIVALARDLILVAADLRDRQRRAELWASSSTADGLQALTEEDGYIVLWRATARDAAGRLVSERAGNGLVTIRDYDPANGHLASIQTGHGFGSLLRHLSYEYDPLDNVVARRDEIADVSERFEYDRLNRLTASHMDGYLHGIAYAATTDYSYDALGNITYKSDIGHYVYGSNERAEGNAGPHALIEASGRGRHRYDANGNLLEGGGRTVEWATFGKPVALSKGATTVGFAYGPDRTRYKKTVHSAGSLTETTWYVGKGYERIEKGGSVTHKYFVEGDEGVAAIYVRHERNGRIDAGRDQVRYLHRDALGSIDTITDGRGIAIERTSFEAFGARRGGDWTSAIAGVDLYTNRGFTGHEHIDEIGLIHMNGRVYDPELGRFLSADPYVQSPNDSQNFNRYSYALNNPFHYTDPSGFFLKKLWKKVTGFVKKAWNAITKPFRKLYEAYRDGGWRGVFAYVVGGIVDAGLRTISGGAVGFNLSYTHNAGWHVGIVVGYNNIGIEIAYTQRGANDGWLIAVQIADQGSYHSYKVRLQYREGGSWASTGSLGFKDDERLHLNLSVDYAATYDSGEGFRMRHWSAQIAFSSRSERMKRPDGIDLDSISPAGSWSILRAIAHLDPDVLISRRDTRRIITDPLKTALEDGASALLSGESPSRRAAKGAAQQYQVGLLDPMERHLKQDVWGPWVRRAQQWAERKLCPEAACPF